MALKKPKDGEPLSSYSETDFHITPTEEPVDFSGDDPYSVAIREIAKSLEISPQELVEKPGTWIYLTEVVLAWFPGTHWQSPTEYDDHEHYRREGLLSPLANLLGIRKK